MTAPEGQLAAVRAALAARAEDHVQPFAHGSMRCVFFAPRGTDTQAPHEQDELYVVLAGRGTLERGGERVAFAAGDALFVPARVEHRFVDFSDDLETWALFWGPDGGETQEPGGKAR